MSVPLSGYRTLQRLRTSSATCVYEAERTRDHRRVVAKVFTLEEGVEARVRHEFRVLQSLDIDGVVEVLGLERAGNELVLLLAHVAGCNLAQYLSGAGSLAVDDFLTKALRLTAILAAVHERRVIHRDIKPSNILVDERTGMVHLADFGISVLLEDTRRRVYDPDVITGTLPYLSPEQTGRTRREVDSRSDLYSLGVTFFELLTGQRPFGASAPLELVHAHLARRPPAPIDLRPDLPRPLSDVIMKLLEKAPEHRYQSARGLQADLERIATARRTGEVEPFELGRDDHTTTLQLPHQLYGREHEQQVLASEFARVVERGESRLVLVGGGPGQGKSALIRSVETPLCKSGGYIAIGKYEQGQAELPYAGFEQAFAALIEQILTESDERLAEWRNRLRESLGPLASVVAEWIPALALVLGELPPPPELELEAARTRLHRALIRFVTAFAEHTPLILALDDLQWSDAASLELLRALLVEASGLPVLVIAAYRDSEIDRDHPLSSLAAALEAEDRVQRIGLRPLERKDLERLLADVLGHANSGELTELAEIVARKTENNPLFVRQFLIHLTDLGLLRTGPRGWTWDAAAIAAAAIPDDVLGVMAAKLERLPARERKVLSAAACIGVRFDLLILATLVELGEDALVDALYYLELTGLISAAGHDYQFSHDRIHEAALALLEPGARRSLHRAIGSELLARHGGAGRHDERLFAIVEQFDQGFALDEPITAEQRNQLTRLDVEAGERALASGAWSSALRYFRAAVEWLDRAPKRVEGDEIEFCARFGHAQALELAGNTDAAALAFDELLGWQLAQRQLGQVVARRIRILMVKGRAAEALDFGIAELGRCGIRVGRRPGMVRVVLASIPAWRLARRVELSTLLARPAIADDRISAALDIIDAVKMPAYLLDQELYALLVARSTHLTLVHGFHPAGTQALAQFAFVVANLDQSERAWQLAEDAILLDERRPTTVAARHGTRTIARLFVEHNLHSFRECTESLPRLHREAIEAGDRLLAGFIGGIGLAVHLEAGIHLREFEELGRRFSHENHDWGSGDGAASANMVLDYAATLADANGTEPGFLTREAPEIADRGEFVKAFVDVAEISGRFLLGEREGPWQRAQGIARDYQKVLFGHFFVPRFALYSALLASERIFAGDPDRRRLRAMIRNRVATLRRWARRCPVNYAAVLAIAEAELAAIEGRGSEASAGFERARALADDAALPHVEGLACLRLATWAIREQRRTLADGALRAAHAAFERWGAWAVVTRLEHEHPGLLGRPHVPAPLADLTKSSSSGKTRTPSSLASLTASLDLGTALETMQAIGEDLRLDEVVVRVLAAAIANAGADRGVLLLERDEAMALVAVGDSQANVELATEPIRLVDAEDRLATSVVHYVLRTGSPIVVDELRLDPRFAADPYTKISGVRALLCMPIVKQSHRVGALMLENHLNSAAFTPERLEVLRVLVGQAASALDNARLYTALGRSEAQWRSLVGAVPDMIVLLDERGRVEFVNHLGRRDETCGNELTGQLFETLLEPAAIAGWRRSLLAVLAGGQHRELELRMSLPGAGPRWFMTRLAAISVDGRVGKLLAISTDTTERKALEAQLHQRQRLESIGTLASGVAHEINNPVQGILNYAELIEEHAEDSETVREFTREITHESERVAAIVRSLLAFSRQERDNEFEFVEVRPLIDTTLSLFRTVLRKDQIALVVEVEPGLPAIRCRPQQIQQVLMNLVTNARDALNERFPEPQGYDEHKRVTIRAQTRERESALWVRISVEDRGRGIPEEIRGQIFDPFFTTKGRDQGTGLGLAVSHGITAEHGGELSFETEVGVGTTFFLTLPSS